MRNGGILFIFVAIVMLNIASCVTLFKTELVKTVVAGDIVSAQKLINDGADINEADSNGMTPLMQAICKKQTQTAKTLVNLGANINLQDKYGYSALFYAISNEDAEVISFLLKKGAYINAKNRYGETALHIAISCMNYGIVKLLVDNDADLNAQSSSGETPLHYAAKYDNHKTKDVNLIIDYLLSKNPKAEIRDIYGWTALRYAVYYKSVDIVAAIRKKSNWSERTWFETSYRYYPEAGLFTVAEEREKQFEYAVNDCSLLVDPTQATMVILISNLIFSPNKYKDRFIECMGKMGFKANKLRESKTDIPKSTNSVTPAQNEVNKNRWKRNESEE